MVDNSTRDQDMNKKQQLVTGPVVIYDVFCLLPVDKHLAANYVYDRSLMSDLIYCADFDDLLLQ